MIVNKELIKERNAALFKHSNKIYILHTYSWTETKNLQ